MITKTVIGFPNRETADAFADGVSYVNDGAIKNITVVKPKNNETTWSVQFKDDGSIDKKITYDRGNM
jgi:tRNA A37 methylthiotransferase MiaB